VVRETPLGITVYPSVWKLAGMATICLLLAAASAQSLPHPHPAVTSVMLYILTGMCSLGTLVFLAALLRFQPILMTTTDGIRLNLSLLGRHPVHPWEHISAIVVQKRPRSLFARWFDQRDLIIIFGDIADILEHASPDDVMNPVWERALRAEFSGRQTSPALYLPMKAQRLARLIAQRNASEIARYSIAIRDDVR